MLKKIIPKAIAVAVSMLPNSCQSCTSSVTLLNCVENSSTSNGYIHSTLCLGLVDALPGMAALEYVITEEEEDAGLNQIVYSGNSSDCQVQIELEFIDARFVNLDVNRNEYSTVTEQVFGENTRYGPEDVKPKNGQGNNNKNTQTIGGPVNVLNSNMLQIEALQDHLIEGSMYVDYTYQLLFTTEADDNKLDEQLVLQGSSMQFTVRVWQSQYYDKHELDYDVPKYRYELGDSADFDLLSHVNTHTAQMLDGQTPNQVAVELMWTPLEEERVWNIRVKGNFERYSDWQVRKIQQTKHVGIYSIVLHYETVKVYGLIELTYLCASGDLYTDKTIDADVLLVIREEVESAGIFSVELSNLVAYAEEQANNCPQKPLQYQVAVIEYQDEFIIITSPSVLESFGAGLRTAWNKTWIDITSARVQQLIEMDINELILTYFVMPLGYKPDYPSYVFSTVVKLLQNCNVTPSTAQGNIDSFLREQGLFRKEIKLNAGAVTVNLSELLTNAMLGRDACQEDSTGQAWSSIQLVGVYKSDGDTETNLISQLSHVSRAVYPLGAVAFADVSTSDITLCQPLWIHKMANELILEAVPECEAQLGRYVYDVRIDPYGVQTTIDQAVIFQVELLIVQTPSESDDQNGEEGGDDQPDDNEQGVDQPSDPEQNEDEGQEAPDQPRIPSFMEVISNLVETSGLEEGEEFELEVGEKLEVDFDKVVGKFGRRSPYLAFKISLKVDTESQETKNKIKLELKGPDQLVLSIGPFTEDDDSTIKATLTIQHKENVFNWHFTVKIHNSDDKSDFDFDFGFDLDFEGDLEFDFDEKLDGLKDLLPDDLEDLTDLDELKDGDEMKEMDLEKEPELSKGPGTEDMQKIDEKPAVEKLEEKSASELLSSVEELKEIEIANIKSKDVGTLFSKQLKSLPDSEKQKVLGTLMKDRLDALKKNADVEQSTVVPEKPDLAFEPVQPTGKFSLYFNQGLAGLSFLNEIGAEVKATGIVSETCFAEDECQAEQESGQTPGARRLASSSSGDDGASESGFDLGQYIAFELRRGDESSAAIDQLGFDVIIDGLAGDKLYFKLKFENPTMVSTGLVNDVMIGTILDESFFCSEDSPMTIAPGTQLKQVLPRLNPGEEFEGVMEAAQSSIESTTSTLMTGQLIMTLVLSVSLKQMWNLFNVMQVLAYVRQFTMWPALVESAIGYIVEAIYLTKVNNAILDYSKSEFEIAKSTTKNEFMQEQGIMDDSLMKSLGVFALSIIIIILFVVAYLLIKRFNCCQKIKTQLNKKLFYSGPLRYIVVGYLKLFNQFATLFFLGLVTEQNVFMLLAYALVIAFLTLWPVMSAIFLMKNQPRLNEDRFSQQFSTLFQGIKFDSYRALCYNAVFSVRRFDIVLVNQFFSKDSPMSGIDRTHHLFKIILFMLIQLSYLSYIHLVHPHSESIFNKLEFINEYCMVALSYLMLNFVNLVQIWDYEKRTPVPSSPILNEWIEYTAIGIIIFMSFINFAVMVKLSIAKLLLKCKKRKAEKAMKARQAQQLEKTLESAQKAEQPSEKLETIKEQESDESSESESDDTPSRLQNAVKVLNNPDAVDAAQKVVYHAQVINYDFRSYTGAAFQRPQQPEPLEMQPVKKKLNRFGRPKRKLQNGRKRTYESLIHAEQAGLMILRQQPVTAFNERTSEKTQLNQLQAHLNCELARF